MKKIIMQVFAKAKGLFSTEKVDEDKIKVNGLLSICFDDRETLEAIITFKKFEEAFEEELKKRNINSLEVSADCEGYFIRKYQEQLQLK